jgi:hypothetical protein
MDPLSLLVESRAKKRREELSQSDGDDVVKKTEMFVQAGNVLKEKGDYKDEIRKIRKREFGEYKKESKRFASDMHREERKIKDMLKSGKVDPYRDVGINASQQKRSPDWAEKKIWQEFKRRKREGLRKLQKERDEKIRTERDQMRKVDGGRSF